jgi:2-pyrone-4,6-dicarboxylate lactonase
VDEVVAFTRRLAPLGMHLQVHFEAAWSMRWRAAGAQRGAGGDRPHGPGRRHARCRPCRLPALRALLRNPLFRVKVSGIDRISPMPAYADGIALARACWRILSRPLPVGHRLAAPQPHHVPDDGALVDALARIAPDAPARAAPGANPQRLYQFPA